mgnify:CR=1 FL=1
MVSAFLGVCMTAQTGIVGVSAAPGRTVWVSPDGNDSGSGAENDPLKSIEAAVEAAKKYKSEAVTVILKAGNYYADKSIVFDEDDSREESAPLTVTSEEGVRANIIGGKKIDTTKFTCVTDGNILDRLPVAARGKVYSLSLKEQGDFYLGTLSQFGTYYGNGSEIPDIYVNGKKMTNARWPNEGYAKVGTVLDAGSADSTLGQKPANAKGAVMAYDDERISRWVNAEDAWLYGYWTWNWEASSLRIKKIDVGEKTLETEDSTTFGMREGQRFMAFNLLEELDSPGEYYIDRENEILYYYPICSLDDTEMLISQTDTIISVENCKNITFERLTVECARVYGVSVADNTENIVFNGCILRGSSGRVVNLYGRNNKLINSDIYDAGMDCIGFSGGKADNTVFELGNNLIENCDIHDFGQKMTTGYGILARGHGNNIVHNRVHSGPAQAMSASGFLSKLEYNEIYDVLRETEDAGAIYGGRSAQDRRMSISYNYIHDVCGQDDMRKGYYMGIYLDDYLSDITVKSNIFKNVSTPIMGHNSSQCTVENNLIINKTASSNGCIWWTDGGNDWSNGNLYDTSTSQGQFYKTHLAIDWTKEPYCTLFPEALNVTPENALEPFDNVIKNNISVNHVGTNIDSDVYARSEVENNLVYDYDPGFVDYENDDFRFREDSEIYEKIPEWQNIDISKIGLYYDENRPTNEPSVNKSNFTLVSPADGAENVPAYKAQFDWNICQEMGIDRYRLVIARDSEFSDVVKDTESGDISKEISDLEPNTTYYWKVAGVRGRGDDRESIWCDEVRSFTTSYYMPESDEASVKIDNLQSFISDKENWKVGSGKGITLGEDFVTFTSAGVSVSGYEGAPTDYNTLYHFAIRFGGGGWKGIGLHSNNTSEVGWVKNSHYLVIIKEDAIEMHKYPESFRGAKMLFSKPCRLDFEDSKDHDIVFGTYRMRGELYVIFAIDGEIYYNFKDTYGDALKKDGYLSVYNMGENSTVTLAVPKKDMPEIKLKATDLPDEYTSVLEGGIAMKAYSPRAYADLTECAINDKNSDITPIVWQNRTLLPLRFISEKFGAEVSWDGESKTARIKGENVDIVLNAVSGECSVNGVSSELDVKPIVKNNTTFVPIRFITENLGYDVYYDDATKDILITEKGKKDNIPDDGNWWKTLDRYIDFGSADTQEFGIMA